MDFPLERERWCPRCRRHVLAREKKPDAITFAVLTIFTCGLALFVIIPYMFFDAMKGRYLCTRCGRRC